MINTVYELLCALKDKGVNDIEPYLDINHNPTIGDMYEGLTKQLLEKGIFKGLDLRVTTGKIKNKHGQKSAQIDCMIVVGEGENIPFTDAYLYDIENVIAVIEVKKNLYSSDLDSAFHNLKSVYNIAEPDRGINVEMMAHTFEVITKIPMPEHEKVSVLEKKHEMLYHTLILETFLPARIVFGYSGYQDEYSLRNNFIKYLRKNVDEDGKTKGYGAVSFPNLIICGESTLIKTNGYPYIIPLEDDDWVFYASYNQKPLFIFLEIIWTKLTQCLSISSEGLFGEDIIFEGLKPLLIATGSDKGWKYEYIELSKKQLETVPAYVEWTPTYLSEIEFVLVNKLCRGDIVRVDDQYMLDFLKENDACIDEIINHLSCERLVYVEGGQIRLLTKQCTTLITPQGEYVAGENKDNRLTNWLRKQIKK